MKTKANTMLDHHPTPDIDSPISPFYQWIPNLLTVFRLACVPLIIFLMLNWHSLLAFGVFALAAITDFLDGYLARRWDVISKFGQIFDPLADKSLLICCYLTLGYLGVIPIELVLLVIGRDILILLAGLSVYLFSLPVKLTPSFSSKMNTFSQIILIGMSLLTHYATSTLEDGGIDNELLRRFAYTYLPVSTGLLIYVTALTTLWSGIEYALYFLRETLYPKVKLETNIEKDHS